MSVFDCFKCNYTLEESYEFAKYGINTTHDADKHKLMFNMECCYCQEDFWDDHITLYCPKCRSKN